MHLCKSINYYFAVCCFERELKIYQAYSFLGEALILQTLSRKEVKRGDLSYPLHRSDLNLFHIQAWI